MGAAAGIYLQPSGSVHESSFAGQCSRLCLGLTAHLSEHRLAPHARPPAALAPPVIHVVPIVSGHTGGDVLEIAICGTLQEGERFSAGFPMDQIF